MAANKIQTGLRINETTYAKLKTISIKENRSINNLVEYVIQKYLNDYEENNGSIPLAEIQSD
ncbi:MAG: hypothetical protein OSJ45_13575 [Lachnospiraceae bacterium]|nr:hypothetical protein [Lachnospiraceae bacterium]